MRIPFSGRLRYGSDFMVNGSKSLVSPQPCPAVRPRRMGARMPGPHAAAVLSVVLLAGLGWLYLGMMATAAVRARHALGPGTGFLETLLTGRPDELGRAVIDALCRTDFGAAADPWTAFGQSLLAGLVVVSMWSAMVVAMMLPTASGLMLAYADVAAGAAARHEPVVSPLVLIAGYVSVWLGFAVVASLLQFLLVRLALMDSSLMSASPLFSGAILMAAGAYQFSRLKHACLSLCRRPFNSLFANWSTERTDVFRLGLREGLHCLGCCWAMMLLMFAVGVMNVVWMAGLGAAMAVEKLGTSLMFTRAIGILLLAAGTLLCGAAIVAHWPA